MKRRHLLLLVAALSLLGLGCTTKKPLLVVSQVENPASAIRSKSGQKVVGYVTSDGTYHKFSGVVRLTSADSLHFVSETTALAPKADYFLPVSGVTSLQISKVKTLATIGTVLLVTTVIVGVTALIVASSESEPAPVPAGTTSSCPFLYSWDGSQFVLDAEPYGGAIAKGLERTDPTELENLVADRGSYRILLTNEMEETQHTNRIDLVVADAPPGVEVAIDSKGEVHGFRRTVAPLRASDQNGRDLLPWLAKRDFVVWHPDLETESRALPSADNRDHLTIEFERPPGVTKAYLLADLATAPWGARTLKKLLEMRGIAVGAFYMAINSSSASRRELEEWNDREELFHLGVEVDEDGRWVRQGTILGGGPVIAETRPMLLDLSRIQGDRVRVRVNPPSGFWMINAFRLAYDEEAVSTRILSPIAAQDQEKRDVLGRILADDDQSLDFPTNDDWAVVTFPAPPRAPTAERRVFARTRGWYDIHLQASSFPAFAEIDRVTREPGYASELALEEFRKEKARALPASR
jgi:hypothetical protein